MFPNIPTTQLPQLSPAFITFFFLKFCSPCYFLFVASCFFRGGGGGCITCTCVYVCTFVHVRVHVHILICVHLYTAK